MRYKFISSHHSEFTVVKMCQVLSVSKSGYYKWSKKRISSLKFETLQLKERIKALFHETHKGMAGSPLITKDLRNETKWQYVSENRVARLMNQMGLKCRSKRKFVSTTNSDHNEPIAPNILNREFNPDAPNKVWVTDITYIKVASRWVYLTVFIDLYSRLIVGWDLSNSLSRASVITAFNKAWWNRKPSKGLIIHSDQGVQYASNEFRNVLEQCGAIQSMSRRGNCWDNAVAESFFHSLKTQYVYHYRFANFEEANRALFWYIEVYYNRTRKHSNNGYITPDMFDKLYWNIKKVG